MRERALRFLPLLERHCAHLVEEIRGLAEGADVPFADALAVQVRSEMAGEGCTTFVISAPETTTGQVLIGQNSDMDPDIEALGYLLRLRPAGKPALLMWTFGGQIGYHGLNAAGVAHFANALGGGPAWKFGLSHYPIKRMILEAGSLEEVLALLKRVPVCSSGNYVLCDGRPTAFPGRIADIELTPEGFEVFEDEGFIAHTNHFVCGARACPANHEASVPDSFPRLERMRTLLANERGRLSVDALKKFLADHNGHPTSICRHPHQGPDHPSVSARGKTVASLIAEPELGIMHVARGNPCQAKYETYRL
jgi:isopenicillin-N N-acyltransferase-like protein